MEIEEPQRPKPRGERIKELCNDSGISAIGRSANAKSRLKTSFWLALLTLALIGFFQNIYENIQRYYSYPILTQMEQDYNTFVWPHVTICNPTSPIAFWQKPELVKEWQQMAEKIKKLPKMTYLGGKKVTLRDVYFRMATVNPKKFFEGSQRASILSMQVQVESSGIITSSDSFDRFRLVRNFSQALTEHVDSSRYPLPCVTLHPERLVPLLGVNSSLEFISIKLNLIFDNWSYNVFNVSTENRKAYVYFTNPNATLKTGKLNFVYTGTTNAYKVQQSHIQRITGCNDYNYKVQLYDTAMEKMVNVSGDFDTCREFASQVLFYQKCGCHNPFLPIYKLTDAPARLCFNMTLFDAQQLKKNLDCLNKVREKYSKNNRFTRVMERSCLKYKQPLCSQIRNTYISNVYPWKPYYNAMRMQKLVRIATILPNNRQGKNVTYDFVANNVATLQITRASSISVTVFEQYEYPIAQLMSNIGGTSGMYLGLSVISLFEILQFLLLLGHTLCCRSRTSPT